MVFLKNGGREKPLPLPILKENLLKETFLRKNLKSERNLKSYICVRSCFYLGQCF